MQDSRPETHAHIHEVQARINRLACELLQRSLLHDRSKLESPEVEYFDRLTPFPLGVAYGSEAYLARLAELRPALQHHYANNRHHPEFHGREGMSGMNLVDLLEMVCDWAASAHRDGNDIRRSIHRLQGKYGFTDEVKAILLNTLPLIEGERTGTI